MKYEITTKKKHVYTISKCKWTNLPLILREKHYQIGSQAKPTVTADLFNTQWFRKIENYRIDNDIP